MLRFKLIVIILITITPIVTQAKPPKGFHEGPYMRIIGGVISSSFDDNVRTGENVATDYEGVYGFQFGWNLWDSTAPELAVRYGTRKVRDNREHIICFNLNVKYSFVTNALTKMGGFQILPFVQGGPAGLLSAVPGDRASNDKFMKIWGLGFSGGTGVDFLIKKYIYLGVIVQCDVHYLTSGHQTVNGVSQKIVAGGWEPQLGITGAVGVHF